MDATCLVSIVIPVFNQEKYLDISLPAVIKQSYTNLQIIVINDGSTDGSKEIIEKYSKVDSRIRVIEKKNGGLVDATLCGVKYAAGDYIAFLDPDDKIGCDFIQNFMSEMTEAIDFVAAGFYYDNSGSLTSYRLEKDNYFGEQDIQVLIGHFLLPEQSIQVSNSIFISRWNKLYRTTCVKKVAEEFTVCKQVTLGEDTIFTYLMLKNCHGGKSISKPNSYYYNVGNQNSMMKSGAIEAYLKKSDIVFSIFKELLSNRNDSTDQAYALFYFLTGSIFQRLYKQNQSEFCTLYKALRERAHYKEALNIMLKHAGRKSEKLRLILKKQCISPKLYIVILKNISSVKYLVKTEVETGKFIAKSLWKNGIIKTAYACEFRCNRRMAFEDLNRKLPELEKRIAPLLIKYSGEKTDLSECSIEKNIFVFWWDGFDTAPLIVQKCFESIQKNYSDCRIIKITKNTYFNYTDINSVIITDFNKGKISVQTFSDILRFNLLKNNGGMWVDATIFFSHKYDLFKCLENEPFTSMAFSTSKDFLQYKGEFCSWSGYFIASRKNAVFVKAADWVFEQYYLKYHTYSIYFFIDAVFMICKLYHIDNDVLTRTSYNDGDMFVLAKLLNTPYDERTMARIECIPQKLNWNIKVNESEPDTFFKRVIMDECREEFRCN